MTTSARALVLAAGVALASAATPADAQEQPPGVPPRSQFPPTAVRSDGPDDVKPVRLANALDQYAIVEAKRTLQLDEATYQQFVPRFRALQQLRRRNHQARSRILQDLRRLAGPRATAEADDAAVRERVNALREHDERAARELRAAYDALDEVLGTRQQARFRIFEENIEARKLELLMRARGRRLP